MKRILPTLIVICCFVSKVLSQSGGYVPDQHSGSLENSVIYQSPSSSSAFVGIGTTTPQAELDIQQTEGGGYGSSSSVLNLYCTYGDFAPSVPFDLIDAGNNTFSPYGVSGNSAFNVNGFGQVGIGCFNSLPSYLVPNPDLLINTHGWLDGSGALPSIVDIDDDGNTLFTVVNNGGPGQPSGGVWIYGNAGIPGPSTDYSSLASLAIVDVSNELSNPILYASPNGIVASGVTYPVAQFDIGANPNGDPWLVPYLFHVGGYSAPQDFLTIAPNGFVGIGCQNAAQSAYVYLSEGYTPDVPIFKIDHGNYSLPPDFVVRQQSVGIGMDPSASYSTVAISGNDGTGIAMYQTSSDPTGWDNTINFVDNSGNLRQVIADDYSTGNLVIHPGWYGYGSSVLEVEGNENISGTVTIGSMEAQSNLPNAQFTNYQLSVYGQIVAQEIIVETTNWQDTVFSDEYYLRSLKDLECFVQNNHHLPGVPSEKEAIKNGISLGEMNKVLLQKVEELTLYMIQMQKEINAIKHYHQ